jgi:hypothetical protein
MFLARDFVPKCRQLTTNLGCVTSQKSEDLIYTVAEAWSHTCTYIWDDKFVRRFQRLFLVGTASKFIQRTKSGVVDGAIRHPTADSSHTHYHNMCMVNSQGISRVTAVYINCYISDVVTNVERGAATNGIFFVTKEWPENVRTALCYFNQAPTHKLRLPPNQTCRSTLHWHDFKLHAPATLFLGTDPRTNEMAGGPDGPQSWYERCREK